METYRIIKDYQVQYKDPIILRAGETVCLGEEEKEEKWKGWIWAETATAKGWVPMQILKISEDKKTAMVLEFYSARELDVVKGDFIQKGKPLNGWTWSKNRRTGEEGWLPDEIIENQAL